jgi:hypothetical protein
MNRICIFCGRSFDTQQYLINSIALVQNVRRHVVGSGRRKNLPQMRPIEPTRRIVRGPGGKEILTTGDIIAKRTRHTLNATDSSSDSAIAGSDNHQETDP